MAHNPYRAPGSKERRLRQRLKDVEERLAILLADSGAEKLIASLDARIAELESGLARRDKETGALKARCGNLTSKNTELRQRNSALRSEVGTLRWDVKVAHSEYLELKRRLDVTETRRYQWAQQARKLADKLTLVRAEMRKLKAKADRSCENSSLAPSCSPNKKTIHNLRVASGRSPGGQVGHVGHPRHHLDPDEVVVLEAGGVCPVCNGHMQPSGQPKKRTLTEVQIRTHTTRYVSYAQRCAVCGHTVPAAFPEGVVNEANYGNSIRALITHIINTCNVSIDKATSLLYEATGHVLSISKGSAHNFLADFSAKAQHEVDAIASRLHTTPTMGSDATYTTASGKRTYAYVFCGASDVLYTASDTKGKTPLSSSPLDGYRGCVVHDHDKSYYHFGTNHAECNAHILRYLKGVCENEPEVTWAQEMAQLLREALTDAKAARATGAASLAKEVLADIDSRYDAIVAKGEAEYADARSLPARYAPEGIALLSRLKAFKDNHLLFTRDLSIPFDNNASERLLRSIKKKTKQTGGFRSLEHGQAYYCNYLSIVQSASSRGMEVLGVIRDIFDGKKGILAVSPAEPKEAPRSASGP